MCHIAVCDKNLYFHGGGGGGGNPALWEISNFQNNPDDMQPNVHHAKPHAGTKQGAGCSCSGKAQSVNSVSQPQPHHNPEIPPPPPHPHFKSCLSLAFITWVFIAQPTNCALSAQDFPPAERVVWATEGSTMCSKSLPLLVPAKFTPIIMWYCPAGGRHNDLSLIQYSNKCNLPHLITANISHHQWTWATTYFQGFAQSTRLLLYHCCALAFEKHTSFG